MRGEGRFPTPTAAQITAETHQQLRQDLAQGYSLAVAGKLDAARRLVNRHLARKPGGQDAEQAMFVLAVAQQRAGLNVQARKLFKKVRARRPAFALTYHHLGLSLYELGDLEGARSAFNVLEALRPGQANTRYHLGLVAYRQGRLDDAARLFHAALELQSGRNAQQLARCHVGLGDVQQRRGALAEARASYEQALGAYDASEEAWYGLNRVLWRLGEAESAKRAGQQHARLLTMTVAAR